MTQCGDGLDERPSLAIAGPSGEGVTNRGTKRDAFQTNTQGVVQISDSREGRVQNRENTEAGQVLGRNA